MVDISTCNSCNNSIIIDPQQNVTTVTNQECSSTGVNTVTTKCSCGQINCKCKYVPNSCRNSSCGSRSGKTVCSCSQSTTRVPSCNNTPCQSSTPSATRTCNCQQNNEQCGCQTIRVCDQNHISRTCNCNTNLYVTVKTSFNMPACDATGDVYVDDANRLYIGATLYSPTIGYLHVMNIKDNCTITVKNLCESCNITLPGEPIPAATIFGIGIPACAGDSGSGTQDGVYLASDYIIPEVGTDCCVTIKVTRLGNITSGAIISIAGYQYVVSDVIDSETVVICNQGDGGTPNTLIKADSNCDNIYDYPIDVIDSPSPCTSEPVSSGVLVVCDGTNLTKLEGSIDKQIPLWNEALGKYTLHVLNNETIDCTTLTSCLILDPLNVDQTYIIDVADSSIFSNPEYAQFQNILMYINGDPFTLVTIISPTRIRVKPFFVVAEPLEYEVNAVICIAECCEQCRPTLETLGRFGGTEGNPVEILVPYVENSFSIPPGISVRNYFDISGAGDDDPNAHDPTEEGLWMIDYTNNGQCKRYIEIKSNFEMTLQAGTGVLANIEYRTGCSRGDTQSSAAIPVVCNDDFFVADPSLVGDGPGNLMIGPPPPTVVYKSLGTYKGVLLDRNFIDPAENVQFFGHIRLTFNNTTEAPIAATFLANIRAWYVTGDYELGPLFVA